jgi:hypothetical protein
MPAIYLVEVAAAMLRALGQGIQSRVGAKMLRDANPKSVSVSAG